MKLTQRLKDWCSSSIVIRLNVWGETLLKELVAIRHEAATNAMLHADNAKLRSIIEELKQQVASQATTIKDQLDIIDVQKAMLDDELDDEDL